MKRTTFFLITFFALFVLGGNTLHAAKTIVANDLTCEYFTDPLGLGETSPRLSWILNSEKPGQLQSAYQILVATDPGRLSARSADMWNSGKVESDQSIQVVYKGKDLNSRDVCWWKVRVWAVSYTHLRAHET